MQASEKSYEDLWSGFESEFENSEPTPVTLDLSSPPSRQRTIGVAHLQLLFSGFYPAFLLCLAGLLMGMERWDQTFIVVGTCLLAVPLAAIFSSVLRGPRRHLGYYVFTALMVGGGTELFLGFSRWAFAEFFGPYSEVATFVTSLQSGLERFFTFSHWTVYLLLGASVAYLAQRATERTPWMDSPPAGALRKGVAGMLLAAPLLLPFFCLIAGTVMEGKVRWYQWTFHFNQDQLQSQSLLNFSAVDTEWSRVYKDWQRASSGQSKDELIGNTSSAAVRKIETDYLMIAESEQPHIGWTGHYRQLLEGLLSSRRDDLDYPYRVADAVVKDAMIRQNFGGDEPTLISHWLFFLDELAKTELEAPQARRLLNRLQQYDEKARTPSHEGDAYVAALATIRSPYGTGIAPEPMYLFGAPFNNSPEQLYFAWQTSYVTDGWLTLTDDWYGLEPAEQLEVIRAQKDSKNQVLAWMSTRCYEYEMQPLWRAAAVLAASKLYKLENGGWPEKLSDLDGSLWFLHPDPRSWREPAPTEFVLTVKDESLQVEDTVSDRRWVLK
ncbi:MAG: hypothetical protein KC800_04330 [Candidatus Eremiobacteraeota bacterium]|nr:hypothetical protein [Candidatus Eremiobacteraeota bacterium]